MIFPSPKLAAQEGLLAVGGDLSLERLLLAPLRLPALLVGKLLGGMVFGLVTTVAVLFIALALLGVQGVNWPLLALALVYVVAGGTFLFFDLSSWSAVRVMAIIGVFLILGFGAVAGAKTLKVGLDAEPVSLDPQV